MTLLTTDDSVPVNACCAPSTSLFSRLIERAGLGAGEERDRHPLHVVEDLGAHVVDQALADPRGEPALRSATSAGVEDRQPGDEQREADDGPARCRRACDPSSMIA